MENILGWGVIGDLLDCLTVCLFHDHFRCAARRAVGWGVGVVQTVPVLLFLDYYIVINQVNDDLMILCALDWTTCAMCDRFLA